MLKMPRFHLPITSTERLATAGILLALTVLSACVLISIAVPQRLEQLALRRLGDVVQVAHGPLDLARLQRPGRQVLPVSVAAGSVKGFGAVTVYGLETAALLEKARQLGAAPGALPPASDSGAPPQIAIVPGAIPLGSTISLRIALPAAHSGESLFGKKELPQQLRQFRAIAQDATGFSESTTAAEPATIYVHRSFVGPATQFRISGAPLTERELAQALSPEALGYRLRPLPDGQQQLEHSSGYLRDDVVQQYPGAKPLLTYLANRLEIGNASQPGTSRLVPYSLVTGLADGVPPGQIALNAWTQAQLQAKPGDSLRLEYYLWLPNGQLETRSETFQVAAQTREGDRQMSVEYPGITDTDSMDNWDAPFPMNLRWIRPVDEAYWKQHRTTPKAFLALSDAQRLWGGRFGQVSSLRAPQFSLQLPAELAREGVRLVPVREQALQAAKGSTEFGGYFMGFSFFLILAALLLAGLLLRLDVEQRAPQLGLFRAVGFSQGALLRLLALRAAKVWLLAAAFAGLLAAGLFYLLPERLLAAVSLNRTFLQPQNLLLAIPAGLACGLPGVLFGWLAYRHLNQLSIRQLLAGDWGKRPGRWLGGKRFVNWLFGGAHSLLGLAWSNCAQRPGRSWLTIGLLALAMQTLTSLSAFRHNGTQDDPRFSHVAESAVPIFRDLQTEAGRQEYGLPEGGQVTGLRVRDGEDISCRNAYAPVRPRVVGLPAKLLSGSPWNLLQAASPDGLPPALVDANSLQYVLHKKVGDLLDLGDGITVRIVGTLSQSLFQSEVLLSETAFLRAFPAVQGYRMWLLEGGAPGVEREWNDRLSDFAFQMEPGRVRLQRFHAVENMYIDIFQVLGWLGLLVGVAGLGIVLARNVVERKKQFALLHALGFSAAAVRRLVFAEAMLLLVVGVVVGVGSGLAIALPVAAQRGQAFGWNSVGLLVLTVLLVGLASCWLAARQIQRGALLPALRSE